ncbi:MAG: DUF2892 domain-containing protein [Halohasta sp.]
MAFDSNVGGTDRLVRALLAAVLSVVAVSALRKRNYLTLLVAGAGALGLGFNATTCFCGLNEALGIDTADE